MDKSQWANNYDKFLQKLAESKNTENINASNVLPTYLIIALSPNAKPNIIQWLIEKLQAQRRDGGAELIVFHQKITNIRSSNKKGDLLHISASRVNLLKCAEDMELMKPDKCGQLREFVVTELDEFLTEDGMHIDDLLTANECHSIVMREVENARAVAEDLHAPELNDNKINLYEGQSIIHALIQARIVHKVFPLHDQDSLKKLRHTWCWSLTNRQPLEEIRGYFGEAIALYFHFLAFYTKALILPTILGCLQLFVGDLETTWFFCVFNIIWITLLLELWKRKSNALAFNWGTIRMSSLDEPRANFRGTIGPDPITGKLQPQFPRHITTFRMYCVSFPIVVLCMISAFALMLGFFYLDSYLLAIEAPFSEYTPASGVAYTIFVIIANVYYRKFATFLTEWENHRTQSQFERHRCVKLVLFEFVNSFMSLFYIAFVLLDMEMLRMQLQTMLIVSQSVNVIQEVIWPLLYSWMAKLLLSSLFRGRSKGTPQSELIDCRQGKFRVITDYQDDDRIEQALNENKMEEYQSTYDDYVELFVQFGYVFLFSGVYPLAACCALLNNMLEVRADAFKLCTLLQRPIGRRVKNIGAWQRAFEALGALSIITNCALMAIHPQLRNQSYAQSMNATVWLLIFVAIEHALLGLRYLLHIAIPDQPQWVRVKLAKMGHQSRQALKFERAQRHRQLSKTIENTPGFDLYSM